jgi:hypothetical protein
MRYRYLAAAILGATALLVAACGGSDASGPTPTPAPELTAANLGAVFAGADSLTVSGVTLLADPAQSGVRAREDILADSFDAADDEADMEAYGWLGNYAQTYHRAEGDPSAIFFASAALTLHETASQAAEDMVDEDNDAARSVGKANAHGSILNAVHPFVPTGVEGGRGLIIEAADGDVPFRATYVSVRRGPVMIAVMIAALDGTDLRVDAEGWANYLAARVQTVLDEFAGSA